MKKILCVLLVVFLLTACAAPASPAAQNTEAEAAVFRVGYGMADITPKDSVPLGGYSRSDLRFSNGFISYLYASCLAVTDEADRTLLLFSLDQHNAHHMDQLRSAVHTATGVPVENIIISVTHTHSAPDLANTKQPSITSYLQLLEKQLAAAAVQAMEDRKPAMIFGGSIATEGMNFVRHYLMNDGTVAGDNFGDMSSGIAGHHHAADATLQLLKFSREGGKAIYVTNFQCHPHQTGGSDKYSVSADVVGEYRSAMEAATDAHVMYFSGAGGNLNSHSRVKTEQATQDFREWGKRLAEYAQKVELQPLETGSVQMSSHLVAGKINHSMDEYAALCKDLYERWNSGKIDVDEVKRLGLEAGIKLNSGQNARSIYQRAEMGPTYEFTVSTVSFGSVAFVAAPFEMFDTVGVSIREQSPFGMTFIATLANGTVGYLPTEETFAYGSYETDSCRFAPGIAEEVADQFVTMLKAQYAEK